MNSYYEHIPGLIKYLSIIDRDVNKILFIYSHINLYLEFPNFIFESIRSRKRIRLSITSLFIFRFIRIQRT